MFIKSFLYICKDIIIKKIKYVRDRIKTSKRNARYGW